MGHGGLQGGDTWDMAYYKVGTHGTWRITRWGHMGHGLLQGRDTWDMADYKVGTHGTWRTAR